VSNLRIVVGGMVAGDPGQGGASWAILQYLLGLRRLGHEVWLIEPVDVLTSGRAAAFESLAAEFDLRGGLFERGSTRSVGLTRSAADAVCRNADVVLDVSGMLRDVAPIDDVPARVYLDLDPAFNQLWNAVEGIDVGFDGHTHFATVGQLLGDPACDVPTCGRMWITTLPPVVLEHWPYAATTHHRSFTTVGNWRSYGSIEYEGRQFGQRAHSLRQLVGIASSSTHRFEVALAIHEDERSDVALLHRHGWRILDTERASGTPSAYRKFIQSSYAEICIAKSGYVESRCGWFSDRSACYLASGRPVLAQDTGFAQALPVGEGLLTFGDAGGAITAADDVCARYEDHRAAARSIAEEHLDSDRVLTRLLEAVGAT
jgi:hypothetical protein